MASSKQTLVELERGLADAFALITKHYGSAAAIQVIVETYCASLLLQ